MFGVLFLQAVRAPFQGAFWRQKLLLGGLTVLAPTVALAVSFGLPVPMVLVPVVVVLGLAPMIVGWGYVYWVFVDALNGAERLVLPEWRFWKDYALAGIWLFLIVAGYLILAAVGLTGLLSALGLMPSVDHPERLSGFLMVVMAASVLMYGFFPIAFARFAAEGRVWAAFDPAALWGDIRRVVRAEYVQACFAFYGLSLMGNLLLGGLPVVGLFLVALFLFFLLVVFSRVFGQLIGFRRKEVPPQT